MEEGEIPTDAKITGKTWAKVNKNGTPDKRYKDNYQIPICTYGCIEIKSSTGLNETYCFSNYDKAEKFFNQLKNYQKNILE